MNSLDMILDCFTSQELGEALSIFGESSSGSKQERIDRLLTLSRPAGEILETFTAEAIKDACERAGVEKGRKNEMIDRLILWGSNEENWNVEEQVSVLDSTMQNVVATLETARVPRRKVQYESDVESHLADYLSKRFKPLATQYSVGGYLGTKIDIDIGNGAIGIEIKVAGAVLRSTEAHRLMGQALYFDRRRYKGNLLVVIAGTPEDLKEPLLAEVKEMLEGVGIKFLFMPSA